MSAQAASDPLPLAAALTKRTRELCTGLEQGRATLYDLVTPMTADLLHWWFGEDACASRRANFHAGQRQAILNVIVAHEVLGGTSLIDLYRKACADAQLEGGLIFGLTAALYGEITIDKGRVQQSNFHDYRMLRIDQAPKIAVHVIKSGEAPGGIGETGATAGPPALRNAIYAATGVPLRRLPIDRRLIAGKKA